MMMYSLVLNMRTESGIPAKKLCCLPKAAIDRPNRQANRVMYAFIELITSSIEVCDHDFEIKYAMT